MSSLKPLIIHSLIILLFSNTIHGKDKPAIPSEKPKLIVGIYIDQMRYDALSRYWNKFEKGGFKLLINEGTLCRNAQINYIPSDNSVSAASISTGTYPTYHGIVGRTWYNNLKDKVIDCAYTESYETTGGTYEAGKYSPELLLTSTFSDEIKIASNGKSKIIGVGLDPETTIFSVGHSSDAAYWIDLKKGDWISSTYYFDSLPNWVVDFNTKKLADTYLERMWEPLLPIEEYTESLPDANEFELGFDGKITFPYNLSTLKRKERNKTQYNVLKYNPYGNVYIKDFAISAIVNEQLGKDDYTDYLSINMPVTSYVDKKFGPASIEMEDCYLRLDKELAHFIQFIDAEVGLENTLFILSSSSGMSHLPGYLESFKIPSGYFQPGSAITLLSSYLNIQFGEGDWIKHYYARQIYFNRELIEDSGLKLEDFQEKASRFLIQFEGVANTVTSTTLNNTNFTEGWMEKLQNSYNQKHSGDIIVILKPGWVEKSDAGVESFSFYSYDTHIPVIWYGWRVKRQKINRKVETIDIAPTICTFLNIAYPGSCIGTPILELIDNY